MPVAVRIELGTDRPDATVHHVAGRHDVRAGVSVRGQTISETTLKDPEDAIDFEALDLMPERGVE